MLGTRDLREGSDGGSGSSSASGPGFSHGGGPRAAAGGGRRRPHSAFASHSLRWSAFKRFAFRKEMLFWWTLGGVGVGLVLGISLRVAHPSKPTIAVIAYPGELLMRALHELVLPLFSLSLLSGVLNLRHTTSGAARITKWALTFYLLSMSLAVMLGIFLMVVIQPGRGSPFQSLPDGLCEERGTVKISPSSSRLGEDEELISSLLDIGRQLFPENIVLAASQDQYLGVIVFVIFFGSVLATFGEKAEPLIRAIEVANETFVQMIYYVVWCTPIGVGSLVAGTVLQACSVGRLAASLGFYCFTVLTGFLIHGAVVLPLTMFILTRRNPYKVIKSFFPAFAMGFGTSSSAATMPLTMDCALAAGCQEAVVRFVVPLGTSVNRDGAALYEAATVLFIAQAHGIQLSLGKMVLVAITATLAAMGAASVPMAALVSMVAVLQAVQLQQFIPDLSLILAVDWAIGMFRTVLNIWGDCTAVVCVDEWNKAFVEQQKEEELESYEETLLGGEDVEKDESCKSPRNSKSSARRP